jgi:hypothetical protein
MRQVPGLVEPDNGESANSELGRYGRCPRLLSNVQLFIRLPADLLEPIEITDADRPDLLRVRHVTREVKLYVEVVGQAGSVDDDVGLVDRQYRVGREVRLGWDHPVIVDRN